VLREFQINLTVDTELGTVRGYILRLSEKQEWQWVADAEFGPNETTLDISTWLTRALWGPLRLRLR
jgi:hypothetical protein